VSADRHSLTCPRPVLRLYWQDVIDLMNEKNPAGDVIQSSEYSSLLIIAVVVSFIAAVKRCWVGLVLGRQTYCKFVYFGGC